MTEITIKAGKFQRLLDYLEQIGLDAGAAAATVNLLPARILELDADVLLPGIQYARLYKAAAAQMQTLRHPIPWGAGVGTEAFEFMCRCIITERTLGDALNIAARFEKMLYPMIGYKIRLADEEGSSQVRLTYRVAVADEEPVFAPENWDRSDQRPTLASASGLVVWASFCGWLIGEPMELDEVNIAAPYINDAYYKRLEKVFRCTINFDASENSLVFHKDILKRRVIHTHDSLLEFLDSSVYHLIAVDSMAASTSAAIKSLITIDLPTGLPSFNNVAHSLHMSESSLRRRLQREDTSYQALKDEVRCEVAIDRLLNRGEKVADISDFLGFTEPSSFVRSFKSWTGETPKGYKSRMLALSE
jgi:AraC-like DNA-binding protein